MTDGLEKLISLPVRSSTWLAPEILEVALERGAYTFVPGECTLIYNNNNDSRPYSIASGADEELLRFVVVMMGDDGVLTKWMADLQPGDTVRISSPYGYYRPGQEGGGDAENVFVATGVGIAPFLSYLRSQRPSRRPVCLYGVRYYRDVLAMDELQDKTDLRIAVSRESVDGTHHGRVTDLLPGLEMTPDTHFYMCGLDAMVDQVAYWLEGEGVGSERVHTEVFFSSE
jgi:ferredoxin-NADP reductase